jgi:hypothetical protein
MERFTCHQASWQKDWIYQLNTRLKNLLKLTGGFELMDVANGFFH